jgi:K+-H+ exchange-related protein
MTIIASMTIYLVPVGGSRYQLYVEIPVEEAVGEAPAQSTGWIAKLVHRFQSMLHEAERARLRRESGEPDDASGLWHAIMRRVAEAIAEQRLLWNLRHQTRATVRHPDDMSGADALREVRAEFSRDNSRHFRWMIIDGVIMVVTAIVLTLIPGPNLIAWYFTFRAIGHFLSWRGARRGLKQVEWSAESCKELSLVRPALNLHGPDRRTRLREIGESLDLKHLAGFVERVFVQKRKEGAGA